jgi:hypothetical protein
MAQRLSVDERAGLERRLEQLELERKLLVAELSTDAALARRAAMRADRPSVSAAGSRATYLRRLYGGR